VVDVAVVKQTALESSKLVFLLAAPFSSVFTSTFLHLFNLILSSPDLSIYVNSMTLVELRKSRSYGCLL
ncbi:hypothetical protein Golax_024204, partial [Gossypium laxum]|nr:hypothetical protein [Gossypium laxum]